MSGPHRIWRFYLSSRTRQSSPIRRGRCVHPRVVALKKYVCKRSLRTVDGCPGTRRASDRGLTKTAIHRADANARISPSACEQSSRSRKADRRATIERPPRTHWSWTKRAAAVAGVEIVRFAGVALGRYPRNGQATSIRTSGCRCRRASQGISRCPSSGISRRRGPAEVEMIS